MENYVETETSYDLGRQGYLQEYVNNNTLNMSTRVLLAMSKIKKIQRHQEA